MTAQSRRLVERIIDPRYLEGLGQRAIEDLRTMREECHEAEKEVSFERRLCQARIDILSAELERRSGVEEPDLMARLPEILATERIVDRDMPLPHRAPDLSVPRNVDVPRRRIEEIVGEQTLARLSQITSEEIKGIIQSLSEHERNLSTRRKAAQETTDAVQAEIVRRYTTGEAEPAAKLR